MLKENFGVNLTPEERSFVFNYVKLLNEYGSHHDFPLPDRAKVIQYHRLMSIFSKLTTEEIAEFNELADKIEFEDFASKNFVDEEKGKSM